MNLRVTHRASLIFRRLIVPGTDWTASRQLGREGMTLQAKHVHQAHFEQARIGGTVRRVATAAALGLHRHVLVNEGSLLVDMALVANRIPARQGPHLPKGGRAVGIVAVVALHQAFVDPVVKGFGKISFGCGMAPVAQLGLALDQQMLLFLGVMRRMAVKTANITAGVA